MPTIHELNRQSIAPFIARSRSIQRLATEGGPTSSLQKIGGVDFFEVAHFTVASLESPFAAALMGLAAEYNFSMEYISGQKLLTVINGVPLSKKT